MERKVLITVAMAFSLDEDSLGELSSALEEAIRDAINSRLESESSETVERFRAEFEYYGATVSLLRQTV